MQRQYFLLGLFLLNSIWSCGTDKRKSADRDVKPETTDQPQASETPVASSAPSIEAAATMVATTVRVQVQFDAPGQHAEAGPSYTNVAPLLEKCMPCHRPGRIAPTLSSYPLSGRAGESQANLLAKIKDRINSELAPMPPSGLLPADQRQTLTQWLSSGAPEFPATRPSAVNISRYKVSIRYLPVDDSELVIGLSTDGMAQRSLGNLTIGASIRLQVRVYNLSRNQVAEQTYTVTVPENGIIALPLQATLADTDAPRLPSVFAPMNLLSLVNGTYRIEWQMASDDWSPANALRYELRIGPRQHTRVNTLRADPEQVLQAVLTSPFTGNIAPGQSLWLHLTVSDGAGNTTLYRPLNLMAPALPPPVVTPTALPQAATAESFPNCLPSTASADELTAWRNQAAQVLVNRGNGEAIATTIRRCFPREVPQCLKTSYDYATSTDIAPSSADTTAAETPQKRPPREFLAPDAAGLEYVLPENIEALAAERGWLTARYKTRHAGGFDMSTASLLMVYVPGASMNPPVNFDRWLNFATPEEDRSNWQSPLPVAALASDAMIADPELTNSVPSIFTVMALNHRQDDKAAELFFQMFSRRYGSPKYVPLQNTNVSECVRCHPNGMRAISPLGYHVRAGEAQLPEATWRAVQQMNGAMEKAAGKKIVSWRTAKVQTANGIVEKPLLKVEGHGPPLGPTTPLNKRGTRSREFIMGTSGQPGCYAARSSVLISSIPNRKSVKPETFQLSRNAEAIRWERVRDAMNCERCHNGVERSPINGLTVNHQVDFKILMDQSMPHGAHTNPIEALDQGREAQAEDKLTADERLALSNCLWQEFELETREINKWLTKVSCSE